MFELTVGDFGRHWFLTPLFTLNQPFFAAGNVATVGGCLASQYLSAWIIARFEGEEAARLALHYVAPVGEKEEYVDWAMKNITPYLTTVAA